MTTGSGDTAADRVRISDADRQAVIDRLREHTAAGRLTLDEFDTRVAEIMASRTAADLRLTLRDLPGRLPVLATEREVNRRLRRHRVWVHLRNFAGINSVCIAIWAMTGGGYFWPEWVIFGTALPMIGYIATNAETDDEKKARKEQEERDRERDRDREREGELAGPVELPVPGSGTRVLATILYTDLVDSTRHVAEMGDRQWRTELDQYEAVVKRSLERTGGQLVKALGDGALARFAAPAEAIRCAVAVRDAVHELGFEIRAGIHAGEIEIRGDDVTGIAVHLGQRVCSEATPGEVWVTRTVVDLVAGAGLHFEDRGEHQLRGVPGTWQLYSVTS